MRIMRNNKLIKASPKAYSTYNHIPSSDVFMSGNHDYPFGHHEAIGPRPTMEDSISIVGEFVGPHTAFYGVFDGHGGSIVSSLAARQIQQEISNTYESQEKLPQTIKNAVQSVNKLLSEKFQDQGSTMAIAVMVKDRLYTANLGDSRIVIVDALGNVRRMTYDHKASDPLESAQIRKNGGMIADGRVFGCLMLSRALGDGMLQDVLIQEPFMMQTQIKNGMTMIIACDGVWDVLTDIEAARLARSSKNPQEASEIIVRESLKRGTTDNVSCIVVKFTKN